MVCISHEWIGWILIGGTLAGIINLQLFLQAKRMGVRIRAKAEEEMEEMLESQRRHAARAQIRRRELEQELRDAGVNVRIVDKEDLEDG